MELRCGLEKKGAGLVNVCDQEIDGRGPLMILRRVHTRIHPYGRKRREGQSREETLHLVVRVKRKSFRKGTSFADDCSCRLVGLLFHIYLGLGHVWLP
uniref:Uncharacterized protein n=1 Tax=Nelumbo nucifera TaxID=4432 RepID=A0A822XXD1_NELNU|nr:TPA_asm: hypothetical protein HUJ06_023521 [Nelumbo nucifera]